ncbi:MAG: hypothetical protein ACFFDR_12800 [Candidatus Thorarchaeota archaeon]
MRSKVPETHWGGYSTFNYYPNSFSQELREVAIELIQALRSGSHRGTLLSLHGDLTNALDRIWMRASDGILQVESIAVLRALRKVTCPDIQSQLLKPTMDYRKILMDLRLFINTVDHLLMPTMKNASSQYRAW